MVIFAVSTGCYRFRIEPIHIVKLMMSDKDWTGKERITLLHAWVSENLYDVALQLLEVEHHKKELALTTDKNALLVLAKNPPVFAGTAQSVFWRLLNTVSDFHGDPSCVGKAVKSRFKVLAHKLKSNKVRSETTMPILSNLLMS
nr:PREDICTED: uncharacterized protein LOC108195065 [Daucus carota subsp. sativus]